MKFSKYLVSEICVVLRHTSLLVVLQISLRLFGRDFAAKMASNSVKDWTVSQVCDLLTSIGLQQHIPKFQSEQVNGKIFHSAVNRLVFLPVLLGALLLNLSDDDLQ